MFDVPTMTILAEASGPSISYGIILASGAVIAALVAQGYNIWRDTQTRKELLQRAEREEIQKSLNEFFGPLKVLRAETRAIYDVFAVKEKELARTAGGDKPYFRTIHHLCCGQALDQHEQALLEEMNRLGKLQLKLVEKYSWAVRNPSLAELFGTLSAHIRALKLASDGKLDGFSDAERLVFPLETDGAIESEMRRLQASYRCLSGEKQESIRDQITSEEYYTLQYYDRNAEAYYAQTAYRDLSGLYEEFRTAGGGLPRGGLILDAGCGVGRDTRYFIRRGYRVVSIDGSEEMTRMCNDYPFAYCEQRLLWDLPYRNVFDGVWACASLVHLSPGRLSQAARALAASLVPGGVIYLSMKPSRSASPSGGRDFHAYGRREIESVFGGKGAGLDLVKFWKNESLIETDKQPWDNYIFSKLKTVPLIKSR